MLALSPLRADRRMVRRMDAVFTQEETEEHVWMHG
jgi:hypothetical protein